MVVQCQCTLVKCHQFGKCLRLYTQQGGVLTDLHSFGEELLYADTWLVEERDHVLVLLIPALMPLQLVIQS